MKTLYYIALLKPKTSQTWTVMLAAGIPILAATEESCRERALAALPEVTKGSQNLRAPKLHHWEIKVASVCVSQ